MIRYIDDFVMCFQYREDALRVQDALCKRLNAMPRNSKTLESKQLGLFEQIEPEIVVTPVQQQQLTMLIEALLSEIAWAPATGEVGNDQDHR